MQQLRALFERRFDRRHHRQRLPLGFDQLQGVDSGSRIVGEDGDDWFADIARHVRDQQRVVRFVDVGHDGHDVDVAQLGHVGAGHDVEDARRVSGSGDVEAGESRMRVRAVQDGHAEGVGELDIVDVLAGPDQESAVLEAAQGGAYPGTRGRVGNGGRH